MTKYTTSIVAALAVSTIAFAGGDIAPVEPIVETPVIVESNDFYVGVGFSSVSTTFSGRLQEYIDTTWTDTPLTQEIDGSNQNSITAMVGYNINQYIALEGRYTKSLGSVAANSDLFIDGEPLPYYGYGDGSIDDFSNWALYVKPMYSFNDTVTIYGLVGYGQTSCEVNSMEFYYPVANSTDLEGNGFQYGAGVSLNVGNGVGLFVDYTKLAEIDGVIDNGYVYDLRTLVTDADTDVVTFGMTYSF